MSASRSGSRRGGRRSSPAAAFPILIDLRVLEATRREYAQLRLLEREEARRRDEARLALELVEIERLANSCGLTVRLRHLEAL